MRAVLIGLLLFVGIELFFLVTHGISIRRYQATLIGIAAVVAIIPPLARGIARLLDRVRHPSHRAAFATGVIVFFAATSFLYTEASFQKRDFALRYHDEYSYRIQTQMIARGRLWQPAHPLPEFFENFQLIATPVYASIYFPGAAMLYAPGVWLHLPHWVIPLLASGMVIALIYRILTEMIDGIAGLLGALMCASTPIFREQSIMVMAQVPAMLGALALIWIYIRRRSARDEKAHGLLSVGLMGAIAGWLLITRPVDALIAIIPVGIAMLLDLRACTSRNRFKLISASVAGAAPFLLIQLIFNLAVTHRPFDMPFDFYTKQVYPNATYGFHEFDPNLRASWPLPQVQAAYEQLKSGDLREHVPLNSLKRWGTKYLPDTIQNVIPHPLLVAFLPLGILGLRGRRWLLVAMLPLFVALYFPYVFFTRHYCTIVIPAMLGLVTLGMRELYSCSVRLRPHLQTFLVICAPLLMISQWPQFDWVLYDEAVASAPLRSVDRALANLDKQPTIVLFRYHPGVPTDLEPAYNPDVAWPDDARVIRAHDRGERNIELFRYYAQRQPDRFVYVYDRGDGSLTPLGNVRELAAQAR